MADLTQEQFDQLPDFAQADYAKDGDVYKHQGMQKLKTSLNDLDSKTKGQISDLTSRLDDYDKTKAEEIEAAKVEALKKAKTSGDVDAVEQRYQEQMADLAKRHETELNALKESNEKITNASRSDKINATVSELASRLATDAGAPAFKALVKGRIDADAESGNIIFKNVDGSASTLDLNGFLEEISNDEAYAPLIKADIATSGGGNVNGNGSGGSTGGTASWTGDKNERLAAVKRMRNAKKR